MGRCGIAWPRDEMVELLLILPFVVETATCHCTERWKVTVDYFPHRQAKQRSFSETLFCFRNHLGISEKYFREKRQSPNALYSLCEDKASLNASYTIPHFGMHNCCMVTLKMQTQMFTD